MNKIPKNKLQCQVSGVWNSVTTSTLEKRLTKQGCDLEEYRKTYVSRSAKASLREGKTVAVIREAFEGNDDEKAAVIAMPMPSED